MRSRCCVVPFLLAATVAQGPPTNGPRPVEPGWFVLSGASVVVAPGQRLDRANVVVRGGVITAVGDVAPPAGATVVDCTGLVVWPGLVEPFLPVDVPGLDPVPGDAHWNPMVQPERSARDGTGVPAADRTALRALGFTTAAIVPGGGNLRGTAAVMQLDEPPAGSGARVLTATVFQAASLQTRRDGYPDSEMGAVALLRQTLHDGQWFERCVAAVAADPTLAPMAPAPTRTLTALAAQRSLPLWFDLQDELQGLRAARLAAEFSRPAVLVGSGMEFRRAAALAATNLPLVVPLHWPEAPDVGTAAAAGRTSLRHLQSWEQAPTNSKRLLDLGVTLAWTTARLPERGEFRQRLAEAMQCGVTPVQALAALTTVPARLLGLDRQLGTIEVGKLANLAVVAGDLFDPKSAVRQVWVGGVRHDVELPPDRGLDGTWEWTLGWPGTAAGAAPRLVIHGDQVRCTIGSGERKGSGVLREPDTLSLRLQGEELGDPGTFWLRWHRAGDELAGFGTRPDGSSFALRARRVAADAAAPASPTATEDAAAKTFQPPSLDPLPTPLGGYGVLALPPARTFVLLGARLWTCDGRGVLRDGAVIVRDGRIVYAGARDGMPRPPAPRRSTRPAST
jgi:imidazolonepropionase-like amidohydrolase